MNDSELYSFFRHLSGNLSSNLSLNLSSNLSLTLSQNSYSNYLQNYLQISFQFWWMIRPIQSHIYSFQIRPKCSYLRFVKLRSFIFPYEYIKSISSPNFSHDTYSIFPFAWYLFYLPVWIHQIYLPNFSHGIFFYLPINPRL